MSARNPTYPGVYVLELPSGTRTITGVSTSITAFVGRAIKGPVNKATMLHSFAEFARIFGGLWKDSNMSFAVYQYYQNGGKDAVIVRVHNGATPSTFTSAGAPTFNASNPGTWADDLSITIDHDVDTEKFEEDDTLFNLTVKDTVTEANLETYRNISTNPDSPRYVKSVLEEESDLIVVEGTLPTTRPPEVTYTGSGGSDGNILTDLNVLDPDSGTEGKQGVYALENIDLFNLLCIPPYSADLTTPASAVYDPAQIYCEGRRAILLVDPPSNWNNVVDAKDNIENLPTRRPNAAVFFPRIKAPNPLEENRLGEFVPCGAVAGVIARTDSERGFWKSAAGIEAVLIGVPDLTVRMTDDENGELNPQGINCLRIFPVIGRVVWGARTMRGADRLADQWKYLAVRRTALYIEESLYRGVKWVVFEPNDERLWSQIRLNVGAFMHDLFRKGAFQGTDPKKAYFVKCDSETTTQYDIDRGIVNIVVGFAPLKPAEFVILQIQQMAGQEGE